MKMSVIIPQIAMIYFLSNIPRLLSSKPSIDYCSIKCMNGQKNTACRRKHECAPLRRCLNLPKTPEFRSEILHLLNNYRESIASGKTGREYGNKGATNMHIWSYDLELEYLAACWANTCTLASDACRDVERFEVAQLFAYDKSNDLNGFLEKWISPIRYATPNLIHSFQFLAEGKCFGCFTQLVSAKTKYVGCALSLTYDYMNLIVCNFGPKGNEVGKEVYKMAKDVSKIASDCKSKNNSKYPSLCGEADPIPQELSWAGSNMTGLSKFLAIIIFMIRFELHSS